MSQSDSSRRSTKSRNHGSILTVTLNSIDEETVQRDVTTKRSKSYETFGSTQSGETVSSIKDSSSCMNKGLLLAKECLQSGDPVTVYDHLADVVQTVLASKIKGVDFIESISKNVKDERCLYTEDVLRDVFQKPKNICEIKRINSLYMSLYKKDRASTDYGEEDVETKFDLDGDSNAEAYEGDDLETKKDDEPRIQDFIETNNYMRQAGFGLPDWEIYDVAVSVMRLVKNMKNVFFNIRFFGKVIGTHKSYYVLETEFTINELERCKRIQSEKEEDIFSEESNLEFNDGRSTAKEDDIEASSEMEVEAVQHEDVVRVINEKTKSRLSKEEFMKDSQSNKSESKETSDEKSPTAESHFSYHSGEDASHKDTSSMKMPTVVIETPSQIEEKENIAREVIDDIVHGIMECIAVSFLKQIQEEMPTLPPEPPRKVHVHKDVPAEGIGEGLNKTVYWVCNNLEDEWICLPDVSPKHIDMARKINTAFTGNLEADVRSFPSFEGLEKHYLRAQLARISSATAVSPLGYYMKGVEGNDEDEEAMIKAQESTEDDMDNYIFDNEDISIRKNPMYKNRSMSYLANNSLLYWVHHRKEIKTDGRITWWTEDEDMETENDREASDNETVTTRNNEARLPRPLFKSLGRETPWMEEGKFAWKASKHPCYMGGPNIVTLRSLRWPGAVAFVSVDKKSDCMYIGYGQKFYPKGFSPVALPPFSIEYDEIAECLDPSVTDEEEQLEEGKPPLRIKKLVKQRSYDMDEDTDYEDEDLLDDTTDSDPLNTSDNNEEE